LEPLAETAGLAGELGLQVLDCGLDAVSAWYAAGFAVGRLAVRLTAGHLAEPDLPETVLDHLHRRELPATCLVVEVDAATASDVATVRPALARLRREGVEVVLTSVVAPAAGVAVSHGLPISGISFHRSVTAALAAPGPPATGLAGAVATAHRMGLRCLVEGVQTAQELAAARRLGIDGASGSLVGRPARARDISSRFSEPAGTTYS
jgi:EAL domain-containing protein (putative c-di-GMP-specific phosphodiesterase class I)